MSVFKWIEVISRRIPLQGDTTLHQLLERYGKNMHSFGHPGNCLGSSEAVTARLGRTQCGAPPRLIDLDIPRPAWRSGSADKRMIDQLLIRGLAPDSRRSMPAAVDRFLDSRPLEPQSSVGGHIVAGWRSDCVSTGTPRVPSPATCNGR